MKLPGRSFRRQAPVGPVCPSAGLRWLTLAALLPGMLLAGCGDDDGVDCPPVAVVSLERASVQIDYWQGDSVDSSDVAVAGAGNGCGVALATDQPWLAATLSDGKFLSIRIDPATVTSGVHPGVVTLSDRRSGAKLTTLRVQLRALMRAPAGAARRVLVIGVDGLRADAVAPAHAPNIDRLIARGAWSLSASTQLQAATVSGPGWASILTGVDADKHGIVSNEGFQEIHRRPYRTFLKRAVDAGYATKLVVHWVGILPLIESDARVAARFGDDAAVARIANEELISGRSQVVFLHFDDADHTGHTSGFELDNPAYLGIVETIDAYVGKVLEGLVERPGVDNEEWLVVLTSDHGGSGTSHGALDAANRTVPVLFAGPSVPRGEIRDASVSHLDVHPTVLDFLGIAPQPDLELDGRARLGRYESSAGL